jgi:pSer/pThr/pTyr-binding forkhead associated (FHA) protein
LLHSTDLIGETQSGGPQNATTRTMDQTKFTLNPRLLSVPPADIVVFTFSSERMLVGRDQTCDLVLPMRDISRKHATIELEPAPRICDAGSHNGTFVNGGRLQADEWRSLKSRAILSLGRVYFLFFDAAGLEGLVAELAQK